MPEIILFQAAFAHMCAALRLLDEVDAGIPAAHIDAALNSLKVEAKKRCLPIDLSRDIDYSALDRMVEILYSNGDSASKAEALADFSKE